MPLALITGAAKRIGRSIALRLSQEGFAIAIHYKTSYEDARLLQEEIKSKDKECSIFSADLSELSTIPKLLSDISAKCGAPDLIVNNAAMFANDDASDFCLDRFERHMSVNLGAPIVIARELFSYPDNGDDKLIVNMIDSKVFSLNPDFFTYTISKYALRGATEMMAMRFAPRIRVCGIAPSVTLISGKQTQENFERSWTMTPLGRGPTPEEIGDAVVFMWQTKSYNGQIMTLDGGQSLSKLPRDVAFLVKEGLV